METRHVFRATVVTLLAAMLVGGSAFAAPAVILPTVDWTPAILSANSTAAEDTAVIDGNLVAWEYDSGIRVKNLATGIVRTIPDSGGSQEEPDVSGDRVVYQDNASGNWDIKMYHWSTNNVTAVRATAAAEEFPRIDGNVVIWWDSTNDDLWGRSYDMAGFVAEQLSAGYPSVIYDVDNGRVAMISTVSGSMWMRSVAPLGEWTATLHTFSNPDRMQMHGDRIVVETSDGEADVVVYDVAADTMSNVAASAAADEEAPAVFDRGITWFEQEGVEDADIGYQWVGGIIVSTPSFNDGESDRYPSIYGHRIAYQRSDDTDQDVMLATSDTKLEGRNSGTDRYGTAAAISSAYFTDATDVVLCNGRNFPDALSAAPLAKALNAPLLLTGPTSLPSSTLTEITRLTPVKVWVIGGSDVVSDAIYNQLDATYNIERIAGNDRYATSAAVARRLEDIVGDDEVFRAFFARGDAFPDALAVGPVAGAANGPVMLVKTGSVPAAIAAAVDDMDITIGYVIGGSDVVSDATDNQLRTLITANGAIGTITERWSGDNRYETATAVAEKGLANRWIDLDDVGFAIGTNFPDALGGGAALGHYGSALLLTKGTTLSPDTAAFLDSHRYQIGRCDFFGGTDVLTPAVDDAIMARIY